MRAKRELSIATIKKDRHKDNDNGYTWIEESSIFYEEEYISEGRTCEGLCAQAEATCMLSCSVFFSHSTCFKYKRGNVGVWMI